MKSIDVKRIVEENIGSAWDHNADFRKCLVAPEKIKIINRKLNGGKFNDEIFEAWIVFEEDLEEKKGYKIIYSEENHLFGLACDGFPEDKYPVFIGWDGDFLTTFEGM